MKDSLLRLLAVLGGYSLAVATSIHAYGLTIQSWSWLVWGNIGVLLLVGLAKGDE